MSPVTIEQFQSDIVLTYLGKGKAKKTVSQIKQVLRELAVVGVRYTDEINEIAIAKWILAWPERTPETFRSHLRCLSSLCTRLRKKGQIPLDPFELDPVSSWMRSDSRPASPRRRYSKAPEEVRRLLTQAAIEARSGSWEACRVEAYANTIFLTGARAGEIQRLETHDIDRVAKTLTIRAKYVTNSSGRKVWWKPKTVGSGATLPIGDHLLNLLLLWSIRMRHPYGRRCQACTWLFPGKRLMGPWVTGDSSNSPLGHLRALGERAGVEGFTCKAGRKGIGTYKEIGLTPMERREYFRHSDDATGDFYDDEKVESMRPAAKKIEQFFIFGT
jgi:integrase